jgi:KaiC/GvpD/RAD55 family RecA-like ATPase
MLLKELTDRSPMRVFENSIHGGLGAGNLGVVVARHGMGKTAFLVDIALDDLMRGRKVLHITIGRTIDHVREYYAEIFTDLAETTHLEDALEVRREIESHRHIKAYLKDTFSIEHLRAHIAMLREMMNFVPVAVVMDGFDFEKASVEDLRELRAIAESLKAEFWMSAHTHRDDPRDEHGIPEPVAHLASELAVIVYMAHDGKAVHLSVLKDHDNPDVSQLSLTIDPTTMLLRQEG